MIGGVLGAYVLSNVHADAAKPFILAYLIAIGLYLVYRGWRYPPQERKPKGVEPLGPVAGSLAPPRGGARGPAAPPTPPAPAAPPRPRPRPTPPTPAPATPA